MANYFDNFQITQYDNAYCRNIAQRSAIARDVKKIIGVFYPYDVKQGQRPDVLAHLYYKKSNLDWLVYFANDIVDPYYGWYLDENQMQSSIIDKYGSVSYAQRTIKHYEVNWTGDDTKITVSGYNNLASSPSGDAKQYWQPILNEYATPIAYTRKPIESTVLTNKILTISVLDGTGFQVGEKVYQQSGGVVTASGVLEIKDSTFVTIKNITGTFVTTRDIQGETTSNKATVLEVKVLVQCIPADEEIYWSPVSYYDYEMQQNEKRKVLNLIDSAYSELAQENLKRLMK